MNDQFLHNARVELELQFYGPRENHGVGSPYAALDARRSPADLRSIVVVNDPVLLQRLVEVGITGSTGAALALVPVIEVAWADGQVQEPERLLILGGSGESAIAVPECAQLLAHWLTVRPQPSMLAAWTGYARALAGVLSPGQHDQLGEAVVDLARAVAAAAGGIGGFRKISRAEEKVLEQVRAAFERPET